MVGRRKGASSTRRGVVAAFIGSLLVAVVFQWAYAHASGGWAALLHVGESGRYRASIESELGEVPLARTIGHDGQASYVIARDPLGRGSAATVLDNPAYRYRRVLYPLLAGGFGVFGPGLTLAGLVALAAAGFGLSVASVVSMMPPSALRRWGLVGVLANPGLYDSLRLLTPDTVAFGFSTMAVALMLRGHRMTAVVAFCCAALTKEVYVLVPLGLAAYLWQREGKIPWAMACIPVILASAWTGFLSQLLGGVPSSHNAFSLPLVGILQARSIWVSAHIVEVGVLSVAVLLLSLMGILVARSRLLYWLGLPWIALALSSSALVWIADAARAFAPLWLIAALSVGVLAERRQNERGDRRQRDGCDYFEVSLEPSVA